MIFTNSCDYTGFMGNKSLFIRNGLKILYICRNFLQTAFNPKKMMYFCRLLRNT